MTISYSKEYSKRFPKEAVLVEYLAPSSEFGWDTNYSLHPDDSSANEFIEPDDWVRSGEKTVFVSKGLFSVLKKEEFKLLTQGSRGTLEELD